MAFTCATLLNGMSGFPKTCINFYLFDLNWLHQIVYDDQIIKKNFLPNTTFTFYFRQNSRRDSYIALVNDLTPEAKVIKSATRRDTTVCEHLS